MFAFMLFQKPFDYIIFTYVLLWSWLGFWLHFSSIECMRGLMVLHTIFIVMILHRCKTSVHFVHKMPLDVGNNVYFISFQFGSTHHQTQWKCQMIDWMRFSFYSTENVNWNIISLWKLMDCGRIIIHLVSENWWSPMVSDSDIYSCRWLFSTHKIAHTSTKITNGL